MSLVLRKLDRRAAFHRIPGVEAGTVQADALSDLKTQGNTLSVWLIDEDRTNLNRIVAALAAGRHRLDKLDYALIDRRRLELLDIQIISKKGNSFDVQANTLWHQDLTELTGNNLLELAVVMQAKAEFIRASKKDVGALIATSINDGFIDSHQINEKFKKSLPGLSGIVVGTIPPAGS